MKLALQKGTACAEFLRMHHIDTDYNVVGLFRIIINKPASSARKFRKSFMMSLNKHEYDNQNKILSNHNHGINAMIVLLQQPNPSITGNGSDSEKKTFANDSVFDTTRINLILVESM
jgi:hypothetical protein